MKTKLLIACLLTTCLLTAQNIFKDDLSTYVTNSPLHSQGTWSHFNNPPTEFGIGNCVPLVSGGSCNGTNVVVNPISYVSYGSSPNSMEIAGLLDNPGRGILPIITNGDLYVGIVIKITTAPGTSTADFLRINNGGNGAGTSSEVAFRLLVQDAGSGYKIGIRKGVTSNATVYTTDIYNYNDTVLVILKYSQLSGTNDDVLNLYANPVYAVGEPLMPTTTTSSGLDQSGLIDRLVFRLAFNTAGTMPTGYAGLISVARTWFDLGFIPLSVNQFDANSFTVLGNNASKGIITINSKMALNNCTLHIYAMTGQLLETQKINVSQNNNDIAINPIHQASVYVVELITENGSKFIKKIITN